MPYVSVMSGEMEMRQLDRLLKRKEEGENVEERIKLIKKAIEGRNRFWNNDHKSGSAKE